MMRGLVEFIPHVVGRLMTIEEGRRQRLRLERLKQIATIHPSALVDPSATITNYSRDPAKVVIGALSSINGHLMVQPQGGRITIGDKSLVSPGTRVWSAASITIGDYVMLSHNINVIDNNSHSRSWRERRAEIDKIYPHLHLTDHDYDLDARPIVIEDDAWVGHSSTIFKGVTIGRGAIVGSNTVVTADVEPFCVVAGHPMRVIRFLDDRY